MENVREHPVIESMMRTGYPHHEPKALRCPVCGEDVFSGERLYICAASGGVIGCESCVRAVQTEDGEDE